MDNQFQILLKAVLDASNIGESDISRVQKVIDKYTVNLTTDLDKAQLLKTAKAIVPELEAELKKITGIEINIDDKTLSIAINQVIKDTNRLEQEQTKAADKAAAAQKKVIDAYNEQANKIRQLQSEGSIQLSFDKVESQYNSLNKLGLITDNLKTNFEQLKQSFNSFNTNDKSENVVASYNKLNTQLKLVKNTMSSVAATAPKVTKEVSTIERQTLQNQIKAWMRVNSNAKDFFITLEKILPQIQSVDAVEFGNLKKEFAKVKAEAAAAGVLGKNIGDTMKAAVQKFSEWGISTSLVMNTVQSFRNAFEELKNINTILTEISKTSNRTVEQLKELGDVSFETASKYGNKASNYLLGIQEMSRAGYENSEQMAELSILAQSAGDMTAELANDYLIASDAAYGYSGNVQKLTALLDGQNQITNRNAVSMEELANATKVAGNMLSNVANIPENELSALLGTGIATSRESGETVARAIKSIMMNLQQVAGEGGFDGELIDEDSLKKVEARCHSVGVELEYMHDGMAKLRDPMDVLKELADVYNSLPRDSADRAGIIADIGGKYRANVLSSILSNFDKYEKMLGDYENSAGSAFEEAMKSANNWEGSLNRLSNTWTDIVGNIANSDGIIVGINALNSLLDVVNKLTSALGAVGTVGAVGTSVGIYEFIKNLDWLNRATINLA